MHAGTLVHEAHWKWWPVHEEASSAYPPDELVPGFRSAPLTSKVAYSFGPILSGKNGMAPSPLGS